MPEEGRKGSVSPPRRLDRGSAVILGGRLTVYSPNLVEKLSEKPRRRLQRCPGGRQRGIVGSISASVYQPYSRSERSSYPFSDSFGRCVLGSSSVTSYWQ